MGAHVGGLAGKRGLGLFGGRLGEGGQGNRSVETIQTTTKQQDLILLLIR